MVVLDQDSVRHGMLEERVMIMWTAEDGAGMSALSPMCQHQGATLMYASLAPSILAALC